MIVLIYADFFNQRLFQTIKFIWEPQVPPGAIHIQPLRGCAV